MSVSSKDVGDKTIENLNDGTAIIKDKETGKPTGFVEDKCNHQKVQMKLLVSFLVLMIICICVSYTTNGYLKHSLQNGSHSSPTLREKAI